MSLPYNFNGNKAMSGLDANFENQEKQRRLSLMYKSSNGTPNQNYAMDSGTSHLTSLPSRMMGTLVSPGQSSLRGGTEYDSASHKQSQNLGQGDNLPRQDQMYMDASHSTYSTHLEGPRRMSAMSNPEFHPSFQQHPQHPQHQHSQRQHPQNQHSQSQHSQHPQHQQQHHLQHQQRLQYQASFSSNSQGNQNASSQQYPKQSQPSHQSLQGPHSLHSHLPFDYSQYPSQHLGQQSINQQQEYNPQLQSQQHQLMQRQQIQSHQEHPQMPQLTNHQNLQHLQHQKAQQSHEQQQQNSYPSLSRHESPLQIPHLPNIHPTIRPRSVNDEVKLTQDVSSERPKSVAPDTKVTIVAKYVPATEEDGSKKKRGRPKKLLLDPATNEFIDSSHENYKRLNKLLKISTSANNPGDGKDNGVGIVKGTSLKSLNDLAVQQLLEKKDKRGRPRKFPIEKTGLTIRGIRVSGTGWTNSTKALSEIVGDESKVVKRKRGRPKREEAETSVAQK